MRMPNSKDDIVNKFLIDLDKELGKIKKGSLSSTTGNHSLLLQSEDLKVWEVTISNAGALVITKVAG
jgi:hypothetical protein